MERFFSEIDVSDITDAIIFLDVDGTLTPDHNSAIPQNALRKITEVKQKNQVILLSNRNLKFSHRKPRKKILESINHKDKSLVVIGDKFLTDGLFAKNIGARFIKVRRLVAPQENILNRTIYFTDDILWWAYSIFFS